MGQQYEVVFVNNSSNAGHACLYQTLPKQSSSSSIQSLAWLTEGAHSNTKVRFDWSVDYCFVWSETGTLKPGVIFDASQTIDVPSLQSSNSITLSRDQYGFFFQPPVKGVAGQLTMAFDETVPSSLGAAGVGMSGAGTFIIPTQPNYEEIFTPHPEYWITFGNYTQGQVMNIEGITHTQQIDFPANVYSMTATLNADNSWTLSPTE